MDNFEFQSAKERGFIPTKLKAAWAAVGITGFNPLKSAASFRLVNLPPIVSSIPSFNPLKSAASFRHPRPALTLPESLSVGFNPLKSAASFRHASVIIFLVGHRPFQSAKERGFIPTYA